MELPKVLANVRVRFDNDWNQYIWEDRDVEVLAVNFNTKSVKVRYTTTLFDTLGPRIMVETIGFGAIKGEISVKIGKKQ